MSSSVESKPTDVCQRRGCGHRWHGGWCMVGTLNGQMCECHEFIPAERAEEPCSVKMDAMKSGYGCSRGTDGCVVKHEKAPQPDNRKPLDSVGWLGGSGYLTVDARAEAPQPEAPPPDADALREAVEHCRAMVASLVGTPGAKSVEPIHIVLVALEAREREIKRLRQRDRETCCDAWEHSLAERACEQRDTLASALRTNNQKLDEMEAKLRAVMDERDALAAKVEEQARTIEFTTNANLELAADMATAVQKLTQERDAERERVDKAEAEAIEQARLNGMGSEREARLMAKLDAAEALLARRPHVTDSYVVYPAADHWHDPDQCARAGGGCAKAEKGEDRA